MLDTIKDPDIKEPKVVKAKIAKPKVKVAKAKSVKKGATPAFEIKKQEQTLYDNNASSLYGDEKPKFTFANWYKQNKEKLAEKRKFRYHNDPEYRAKLKVLATKARLKKVKVPRRKSTKMTIPKLCAAAGCSPHTYRKYCQLGWVPAKNKLVFTEKHVALLEALCTAAKKNMYEKIDREEALAPLIKALHAGWN